MRFASIILFLFLCLPPKAIADITQEQIFNWRLEIEQLGFNPDGLFHLYQRIFSEIGTGEFTYQSAVYNETTLRSYMLWSYPRSQVNAVSTPQATAFFEQTFEWYEGNISRPTERLHWLSNFLEFLSRRQGRDALMIMNDHYEEVQTILDQYITLQGRLLRGDQSLIGYRSVYTTMTTAWISRDMSLLSLDAFSRSEIGRLLRNQEKNQIIDFLIPEFAEYDTAIQIYSRLSSSLNPPSLPKE